MDSLCVRFNYRGEMRHDGKEWQYIGGKSGMSTVFVSELSLASLKRHLADHVCISEEALEQTGLTWRLVEKERNCNFMCTLDDNTTVNSMARHVRRVADGFVDIYVRIPQHATDDSSDDEENGGVHQEIAEKEFANEEQNYGVHHVQHGVEQPHVHHGVEQPQLQHGVEQPQVQHGVEQPQMQHGVEQPQVQHELTIEFVEKIIEPENLLQRKMMKLPIVRPPMHDKGKEIVQNIAPEQEDFEETSDSDYDAVHEADSEDSSADDEEAICYRKQALELKKRVKIKMLGEEEMKATHIPEDFIVPENVNLQQDDGSECFDSEDELSYSEDSDGEGNVRTRKTKHRVYDENADVKEFELGQAFHDSREFKQAVVNYGLKKFHHLLFPKDERTRVLAKCSWLSCPWRIYGSLVPNRSEWFTVSRYNNVHTCVARRDNKLVTSTVIAEKYFREIKDNPGWRIEKMQEAVLEDLCADVSESKCKRAKKIVMERIIDTTNGEFSRVFDYHLELVRSNPGSTVAVNLNPDVTDKPVFERMYVCLDGCKRGFVAGCRRIVGLDGCFLKGAVSGQLLCAIGRDPNNQMYPIAWATVEGENHDSWYWFLALLQKDIQINNQGDGWVIISDQQKGLIKAVGEIIPNAEHRMCARHIYANWRKQHRDKVFQKLFWACAKSSDKIQFNYNRAKLAQKTPEGARDMMKTDPEHWCRAFFRLGSYCDSVENNLCESFNNAIMRARFYPIISSMEIIRRKVTARIAENKAKSEGWSGTICPNIFKKLNLNVKRSRICTVLYNGSEGFEVMEGQHRRFTVNLERFTCSCRYWDLSGLPCCHAISAIYTVQKNLDDFIAPCYRIDVYDKVYSHVLQPVEGKESWPVAPNPRPFPPVKRKMPGRPKTERRREEQEKPKGNKLSRKGCKIKCSMCGGDDHNKRKCKGNPDVVREHALKKKSAKRSRNQQDKAAAQQASSSAQEQEKHKLYYEKNLPGQKKNAKNQATAQRQDTTHQQVPSQQHAPALHQVSTDPRSQPANKRQKKMARTPELSSSQPSVVPTSQTNTNGMYFARTETVPMSQVVTEPVPKSGRLNWYLGGSKKKGRDT